MYDLSIKQNVAVTFEYKSKDTTEIHNTQSYFKRTKELENQQQLQDRTIKPHNNLSEIPSKTLTSGMVVRDYTKVDNFAEIIELMSYAEAEKLSEQIKENTEDFPMPCMAITADRIATSLETLLKQYIITEEDKSILDDFKNELSSLSPHYPYKASLIATYKFLLYKSLIEYKFHINLRLHDDVIANYKSFYLYFTTYTAIKTLTFFNNSTNLTTIKNLPWPEITSPKSTFFNMLINIYASNNEIILYSLDLAFKSGEVLIPYSNPLDIKFFNKRWLFPVNLIGCSFEEFTSADGLDMSSREFFEHDLGHLSDQIKSLKLQIGNNKIPSLLNWVNNIYANQDLLESIKNIKFSAIELVLFSLIHERAIVEVKNIEKRLEGIINNGVLLMDLPKEYVNISINDIINAAKFLYSLPVEHYSEKSFSNQINHLKNNITSLIFPLKPLDQHLAPCFLNTSRQMPDFILKMIETLKNKIASINNIEYEVTVSRIEANLRNYYKQVKSLPLSSLNTIDEDKFLSGAIFIGEAKFIINLINE